MAHLLDPPDVGTAVDAEELLGLHELMTVIRRTEKAAHDLFLAGLVKEDDAPGGRT